MIGSRRTDLTYRHRSRLRHIYRRWQRVPKHLLTMDRWAEPLLVVAGRQGAWIAFVSSILLIPFSNAVIPLPDESKLPFVVTLMPFHPAALLTLAMLWLVNAWLIDRHLTLRTPQEFQVVPWLRRLRFFACGLPLVGPLTIPGWRWLLSHRPDWAFQRATLSPLPSSLREPAAETHWRITLAHRYRCFAVAVNRRLTTDVGLGLLELANAIVLGFHHLADRLRELGRVGEALATTRHAVDIQSQLAEAHPDAFLPDLAMGLRHLGAQLSEHGRPEEALDVTRRALATWRKARPLKSSNES